MLPVSKKTLEAVQTALDSVEFPLDGKLWRPTGYQLHALRYLGTGEQEAMVVPGGQSTLRSLADKGLVDNRNTVRWSGGEITLYRLTRRGRKFLKRASLALKLKNIMNTVTGV